MIFALHAFLLSLSVLQEERRDLNFFMLIFGACQLSAVQKVVLKSPAGTCRFECRDLVTLMTLSAV